MEEILEIIASFFIGIFVIIFIIYVACAIFLSRFNKLVNGKGTILAWIPIANVYLLGKLTVNKAVGCILVICSILTGEAKITIGEITKTHTIFSLGINSVVSVVYSISVIILFIYAIIKYNKLKRA